MKGRARVPEEGCGVFSYGNFFVIPPALLPGETTNADPLRSFTVAASRTINRSDWKNPASQGVRLSENFGCMIDRGARYFTGRRGSATTVRAVSRCRPVHRLLTLSSIVKRTDDRTPLITVHQHSTF